MGEFSKPGVDFGKIRKTELERRAAELDEIERLAGEQSVDNSQTISGSSVISAYGNEDDSYEKRLDSMHNTPINPEQILIQREQLLRAVDRIKELGEKPAEVFNAILDGASIEEIAEEMSMGKREVIAVLQSVLTRLDAKYSKLFEKKKSRKTKASSDQDKTEPEVELKVADLLGVMPEKEIRFDEITGRVILSEMARSLSLDKLKACIDRLGYSVSRATVYRAKNKGHFTPSYHEGNAVQQAEFVPLDDDEKVMTSQELSEKFGISLSAAQRAKDRGYFQVNTLSEKKKSNWKFDPRRIRKGLVGGVGKSRRVVLKEDPTQ